MNEKNKLPERANAPGRKITAEEIAAALKTCARSDASACRSCPMGPKEVDGRCCFDALRLMAAELIEAQGKRIKELEEQARWIPVSERLPDAELAQVPRFPDGTMKLPGYEAIVHIEGAKGCTTLWYLVEEDGTKLWCDDEGVPYRVTHWKPMPDGPEGA